MRRHDQTAAAGLERADVRKRRDPGDLRREIDQEDVLPLDRALDAGQQHDAARRRVALERRRIEIAIVQRDGERVVAERRRVIDQILGAMADAVGRILIGVGVELDLEHAG